MSLIIVDNERASVTNHTRRCSLNSRTLRHRARRREYTPTTTHTWTDPMHSYCCLQSPMLLRLHARIMTITWERMHTARMNLDIVNLEFVFSCGEQILLVLRVLQHSKVLLSKWFLKMLSKVFFLSFYVGLSSMAAVSVLVQKPCCPAHRFRTVTNIFFINDLLNE